MITAHALLHLKIFPTMERMHFYLKKWRMRHFDGVIKCHALVLMESIYVRVEHLQYIEEKGEEETKAEPDP